jgi:imidazolonepropionase-like amidohydrolase
MKAFLFALVVLLHGNIIFCQDRALVGAKIYPSPTEAPIEKGVILIRKGKITAVGSADKIVVPKTMTGIDCRGLILTAAFWNCHVHFMEPKWEDADLIPAAQFNKQMAQMITSHGFAHVFDLAELSIGTVLRIRDRIKKGDVNGPVIYTTGVPLTPPNGSPFYIEPLKLPEASDPQQAAAHVRQQIDSGADAIKIWTGSPVDGGKTVYMPEEIVRQVTQTAYSPAGRKGMECGYHSTNADGTHGADPHPKAMEIRAAEGRRCRLGKQCLYADGAAAAPRLFKGRRDRTVRDRRRLRPRLFYW